MLTSWESWPLKAVIKILFNDQKSWKNISEIKRMEERQQVQGECNTIKKWNNVMKSCRLQSLKASLESI